MTSGWPPNEHRRLGEPILPYGGLLWMLGVALITALSSTPAPRSPLGRAHEPTDPLLPATPRTSTLASRTMR